MRRAVDNADAWTDLGQDRSDAGDVVGSNRLQADTEDEMGEELILGI